MTYFTKDYHKFFKELHKNNNREWFHANKKRYETSVKKPFYSFVEVMIDKLSAIDKNIVITPKDAIFRINRDIRFSKDKTPYKTQMSAILSPGGRKNMHTPGLYIQFGVDDVRLYSGMYMVDKNVLQRVRENIVTRPKEFKKLITAKKFVNHFGEIHGEKNKRIPKEFREPAEQQPLLFNKSFYYFATFKPTIVEDANLPKLLINHFKAAQPLNAFLAEALIGE